MVLTGSCGPTPVLEVHKINKKTGSLCLKTDFHPGFRFSRSDLPVWFGFKNLVTVSIASLPPKSLILCFGVWRERRIVGRRVEGNIYLPPYLDVFKFK